jgi:hypothetical protein
VQRDGAPVLRRSLTVTRKQVTIRTAARARAAASSIWNGDQAWLVCGDLYHPESAEMLLNWHTLDGTTRYIYWQVWMESWWEDPEGVFRGRYWKTPSGWGTSSPLYGRYRENQYGIVELEYDQFSPFGGSTIVASQWWWQDQYPMGYHVWVRGWARLWTWTGTGWGQVTYPMSPTSPTTDAPGYCYYP